MKDTRCKERRFQTPLQAQIALKKARKSHMSQGRAHVEASYYYCDNCCGYHLSSWQFDDTTENGYNPNGGKHHTSADRLDLGRAYAWQETDPREH